MADKDVYNYHFHGRHDDDYYTMLNDSWGVYLVIFLVSFTIFAVAVCFSYPGCFQADCPEDRQGRPVVRYRIIRFQSAADPP
jgi:hypothetical protein